MAIAIIQSIITSVITIRKGNIAPLLQPFRIYTVDVQKAFFSNDQTAYGDSDDKKVAFLQFDRQLSMKTLLWNSIIFV